MPMASDVADDVPSGHIAPDFCHYCNYFQEEHEYLCDPTDSNACEACRKLSELEKRIQDTRRMLVGLANERIQLKEQVNRSHDRVIHRLPPEVASNVFELCLPEDAMDLDPSRASKHTLSVPFILSAVCRRSKLIAHSTPRLWSVLLCAKSLPGSAQLVENWIDRSGNVPLSINLYIPDFPEESHRQRQHAIKIINVLNCYCDRWQRLRYKGPSSLLICFANDQQDLPKLRTLHLKSTDNCDHYVEDSSEGTLNIRPKQLSSLSLSRVYFDAMDFDAQYLTHLELHSTTMSECLTALQKGSLLTHCIFMEIKDNYLSHAPEIIVHNIQYLKITGPMRMITYLSCPSLTSLLLSPGNLSAVIPSIITFLKRSGCSLETFSIEHVNLSDSEIGELCQGIPTLQHLEVHLPSESVLIAKSLITRLAKYSIVEGRKVPRYLPLLRSFTLSEGHQDDLTHWQYLPKIFGSTSSTPGNRSIELRRPFLKFISVKVRTNITRRSKATIYAAITRRTLERMLWLESEKGVKCELQFGWGKENIIHAGVEWYNNLSTRENVE